MTIKKERDFYERAKKGEGVGSSADPCVSAYFPGFRFPDGRFLQHAGHCGLFNRAVLAFIQNRSLSFADKIKLAAQGVGEENIITMCLFFWLPERFPER